MVTPVVASSSPLSVRGSAGTSYKRSVSGRTSARPVVSSLSGGTSVLQSAESAQQLFSSFSASTSTRGTRDVCTSPTSGPSPAAAVCVGFDVASEAGPGPVVSTTPRAPAAARGLLSRALGGPGTPPAGADSQALHNPFATGIHSSMCGRSPFPEVDTGLLRDLQERHPVFYTELVITAYMLAAKAHEGQQRRDGTSQLSHCVLTALQLAELGLDSETVAAGLLHETLRYNPMFRSQMEEFMPSSVLQLVERVTTISEISHLYRNNRDALGEEKMRRMLLAMEDVKAVLVKLACRVHNMKTLGALPRDKQLSFARETLDIFAVVANRLGCWSLKAELEDLAFAVLHPKECEALREQVAKRQDAASLEATIAAIKASLDARGVAYADISGRPKNLYGIWCKMQEGGLTSLDQVFDVTALRIVVTHKHDCYAAMRCIQEVYNTVPGRYKDFIKDVRKPNGYQSLHDTIYGEARMPVEVQVRTHKMHYIAEYGFAAHWKYKEKLGSADQWLDKEIQYKKWLTAYKLGLHDKKVRAAGAPRHETALHSLGIHLLDGSPGGRGADLPGVDSFLRHDRFRLQAPEKQHVAVVVQTQDSIDTRELSSSCTAASLARQLRVDQLPGYVMTVNSKLPAPGYVLCSGDLVQVVPESEGLSRSPLQPSGIRTAFSTPFAGAVTGFNPSSRPPLPPPAAAASPADSAAPAATRGFSFGVRADLPAPVAQQAVPSEPAPTTAVRAFSFGVRPDASDAAASSNVVVFPGASVNAVPVVVVSTGPSTLSTQQQGATRITRRRGTEVARPSGALTTVQTTA